MEQRSGRECIANLIPEFGKPLEVFRVDRRGRLDLDAGYTACSVFQDLVQFHPVLVAEMVEPKGSSLPP